MEFRLKEISKIKNSFIAEICEREKISSRFSKYIAVFDYVDKTLLKLSAAHISTFIASFETVAGAPVGIVRTSLDLVLYLVTELNK